MNKLVNIIIPIYKSKPSYYEEISYKQCLKILKKYPITLVAPINLDLNYYTKITEDINIYVERFEDKYFKNIDGYNCLLRSLSFYSRFRKYKYILINQLDSFVFRDELENWCKKDYDYIGAPWFKGGTNPSENANIAGVGNGGFSLRKTKRFVYILNQFIRIELTKSFIQLSTKNKILKFPKFAFKFLLIKQKTSNLNSFNGNEDTFWCIYANKIIEDYLNKNLFIKFVAKLVLKKINIAPAKDAFKFSVECLPKRVFKEQNNTLPFGCHAWLRYEFEFWKYFIEKEGYEL